jgi:hypothetical protein
MHMQQVRHLAEHTLRQKVMRTLAGLLWSASTHHSE